MPPTQRNKKGRFADPFLFMSIFVPQLISNTIMARPDLLSADIITKHLDFHPLWHRSEESVTPPCITRELHAANWAAAIGMVNAIAIVAEQLDHHPDILIYGWNKLRISVTTHDRGGLTELDFKLAEKIDALALNFSSMN